MDPGRRAEYRVKVDDSDALGVKIRLSGGREVEGKLIDLSGSGAGIQFEQPDCPTLTVGDEADLVFESANLDSPISVAARIQHRNEEDAHRRYGFRFLEPQHLESLLMRRGFRQYRSLLERPAAGCRRRELACNLRGRCERGNIFRRSSPSFASRALR